MFDSQIYFCMAGCRIRFEREDIVCQKNSVITRVGNVDIPGYLEVGNIKIHPHF